MKPPLLQQAAFDDLLFRVDVMRNVASRHLQNDEEEEKSPEPQKWNSLPSIPLPEKEELKSKEEEDQNDNEGLQEVTLRSPA